MWNINEYLDLRRAQEIAATLQSDDEVHAKIISSALGCRAADVLGWIKRGVVWNAETALKKGLVHEIVPTPAHLLDGRIVERIYRGTLAHDIVFVLGKEEYSKQSLTMHNTQSTQLLFELSKPG